MKEYKWFDSCRQTFPNAEAARCAVKNGARDRLWGYCQKNLQRKLDEGWKKVGEQNIDDFTMNGGDEDGIYLEMKTSASIREVL